MIRNAIACVALLAMLALHSGCRSGSAADRSAPDALDAQPAAAPAPTRPATWATPLELPGVPNLHRINEHLYRSAQPQAPGFKKLETQLGLRSVICLRRFHTNVNETQDTLLRVHYVPISPWSVTEDEIIAVLRIIARQQDGPFLVHCLHGADRSGLACAAYRVVFEHWTPAEACEEMRKGGYGFHELLSHIPELLLKMDFDRVRQEVLSSGAHRQREP
jgi:protein tyrosine phosphatase (PTP) superfamily phosphohydrolase (DUF442 family)